MSASGRAVFLSYASQDAEAGRRICDALRGAGLEVWFDQSELRGGDAWDAAIRKQIKECALFVPIISANTNTRSEGYFRLEWKLAVDRSHLIADDQAFLVPVVIDAMLEANARVPEKFRDVQWTYLLAEPALAAFGEHVRHLLSGEAAQPDAVGLATITTAREPPSIAVLPFVNRSHNAEDEYFSDGLADELLNVLTKIRGLRVAARTSSFQFRGKNDDIAVIGRKLNVATVLEGSVRKSGNQMRIAVQLVKVADGYQLWSERYDRTLEDIFAVQDDIAHSVVKELRATLLGDADRSNEATTVSAQVAAAVKGRATDAEAHRLYLQARHLIDRHSREDNVKGIEYLKQALQRDPEFALAWAELSRAYTSGTNTNWAPLAETLTLGRDAVTRALDLEPDLAEGHAQMGWIQMAYDWHWRDAQASYARALRLAPGNATALRRAADLAANLGHVEEAIGLYGRAIDQDPLSLGTYQNLGLAFDAASRLAEAEVAYRKAIELSPQSAGTRACLALNLLAQGHSDEALTNALREPEDWLRLWALGIIHHTAGRPGEADAALHELIAKHGEHAAYQVAEIYAVRDEPDLAFEWLERAYMQRDSGLSEMRTRRYLLSLHADPRWRMFLHKMGLTD